MTVMHAVGFSHRFIMGQRHGAGPADGGRRGVQHRLDRPRPRRREYQVIDEFQGRSGRLSFLQAGRFLELDKGRLVAYIQDLNDKGSELQKIFVLQRAEGTRRPRWWWRRKGWSRSTTTDCQWLTLKDGSRYEGTSIPASSRSPSSTEYSLVIRQQEMEHSNRKAAAKLTMALLGTQDNQLMAELQWRLSLPCPSWCSPSWWCRWRGSTPSGRYAKLPPAILLYLLLPCCSSAARSHRQRASAPLARHVPGALVYLLLIGLPLSLQGTSWWNGMKGTSSGKSA